MEGWELSEFEKCLEKVTYTNKIQRKDFKEEGIYPIISQEQDYINGYWDNENDLFKVTKPIVVFGDHTQVIKFVDFDFVLGADGVKILKTNDKIDSKYFYYFLQNTELGSLGYARHYRLLKEITVPYPKSLPEQQRIVAILDECFAALEKAKANAEQNLKNAKELFDSYLQGVFENGDWEKKKLNEITEVKDGTHDSPKYIKDGIPFVTQKNIKPNGLFINDTKFITETDHEKFYTRSNVTYGDILISMIGANRGMAAIVDNKRVFSIKNVGLIKSSENINMNYLLYYLKSSIAMKYVLYMSNGGAQEFVGLTALRSFPIPYPSLKEQNEIVKKLDALILEVKKLEGIYQQKVNDLEELKKSILQKAFAGELKTEEEVIS
jgi:type I restriction enzyme S subunit